VEVDDRSRGEVREMLYSMNSSRLIFVEVRTQGSTGRLAGGRLHAWRIVSKGLEVEKSKRVARKG
jgi:hypothetical protein